MPWGYQQQSDGSYNIGAYGQDYTINGSSNESNHVTLLSGNDVYNGGNAGDSIYLGAGNDTVHAGNGRNVIHEDSGNDTVYSGNGDNYIYAGSGRDIVYGGHGFNWMVFGTGEDTMFASDNGPNFFDFSQTSHTGLTSQTQDLIMHFNQSGNDMIGVNQSVADRGTHVIDSSSTTSIEQALHLAQTADVGHDYGAVYVANHSTGTGYLLMDNNNDHHFDSGVTLSVGHQADSAVTNAISYLGHV